MASTERRTESITAAATAAAGVKAAALRREVPCTVAVLLGDEEFAAMRQHSTHRFTDYEDYLRHTDDLLQALHSRGMHVRVTAFDPGEFTAFCAAEGLDPGDPVTRARYAAAAAAAADGVAVDYQGEQLDAVIRAVLHEALRGAERRAAREYAQEILGESEHGRAAFSAMARGLTDLVERAGPGAHQFVCSASVHGTPLLAVLQAESGAGAANVDEGDATLFCSVLAAGIVTGGSGGVVLRTSTAGDRNDTVRGWTVKDGALHPLNEAEVFNAYCTDHRTGEPIAPEPGVDYRAGYPLTEDDR